MDQPGTSRSSSSDIDANVTELLNTLKIYDTANLTVHSIQKSNLFFISLGIRQVQYELNVSLPNDFKVELNITYQTEVEITENTEAEEFKIVVYDAIISKEIKSITNYLQRQKNIHLALSVLKRCALIVTERNLMLDMLNLHCECLIDLTSENGGLIIKCINPKTEIKYFECLWKIQFYYQENFAGDYFDVDINTSDQIFQNDVTTVFTKLVEPNLMYNVKLDLWWRVITIVNNLVTRDILGGEQRINNDTFVTIKSPSFTTNVKYEVLESDEEDCIIID